MTPRLRLLLIGLGISLVILVVDQINTYNGNSKKPSKKVSQPRKKVVKQDNQKESSVSTSNKSNSIRKKRKNPSNVSQLVGWQRNPFSNIPLSNENSLESSLSSEKQIDADKSILLKALEKYNVEIVAEFNNEKIVFIDNKRFREGEYLNEILIESITNDEITFKLGRTSVKRSVGN